MSEKFAMAENDTAMDLPELADDQIVQVWANVAQAAPCVEPGSRESEENGERRGGHHQLRPDASPAQSLIII